MKKCIIEIIKKTCALNEDVTTESELKLLSLDSLSFVAVLVEIEEKFNIEFELDEILMSNWQTVGDVIKLVEVKISEKKYN